MAGATEVTPRRSRWPAAAGVDPAVVCEAMRGGFVDSTVLDQNGSRMLRGDYEPGGAMRLHLKDLRIVLDLAAQTGTPTPAAEHVAAAMAALVDAGHAPSRPGRGFVPRCSCNSAVPLLESLQ